MYYGAPFLKALRLRSPTASPSLKLHIVSLSRPKLARFPTYCGPSPWIPLRRVYLRSRSA